MKRNNIISTLLLICTLVSLGSFFFIKYNNNKNDEKKSIVVGLDVDVPPIGYIENGEIVGFDVDLARATFSALGKNVIFQPINWDAKELELNSGSIDVIWNGMSYTPERDQNMLLTKPYTQNRQVFIIKNNSNINSLNDLKNKIVCVQKGSSGEGSLKDSKISNELKEIIGLETMLTCLKEVQLGKSDATVVDEIMAKYYINQNSLQSEFKILDEELAVENNVIAVKKGNESLKNEIENGLSMIINSGEASKISNKWFGENIIKFGTIDNDNKKTYKKIDITSDLLKGLLQTLKLFSVCLIFSIPLGLILCILKNLKFKPLKFIVDAYIWIMRGTPLLLQIFFIFYGIPLMIPKLQLSNDRFLMGSIAFILNYAAYFAEIFRGGLKSINKGQFEAIKVLKIPKSKSLFKIIIPQAFRVCLPSVCNELVSLVKDTSLIFSIGIIDLLTATKDIVNTSANITIYAITAGIYLSICALVNLVFNLLEKKLNFE